MGTPLDLVAAVNEAWSRGRAAQDLPGLLAADAVIVGPDLARLAVGRDACVESYVRFADEVDLVELEAFDHRVDSFGGAAVVDYAYRVRHRRGGAELTEFGRDVILAVEGPDGWRVAWRMARPDL